jgi:hypothetical protein
VIDNQVGHELDCFAQGAHIVPRARSRIDARVIDRIETRVGGVDGVREGQQMRAS